MLSAGKTTKIAEAETSPIDFSTYKVAVCLFEDSEVVFLQCCFAISTAAIS